MGRPGGGVGVEGTAGELERDDGFRGWGGGGVGETVAKGGRAED